MAGTAALVVGLVVAIADGDTLTVLNEDFQQVKVRLAEIDAPEARQPFGTRSRQSLGDLCHEKRAEVRVVDVDRYKRIVGRVTCAGVDANAAQVRRGLAWVYDRYAKDKTLYRLQDEARASDSQQFRQGLLDEAFAHGIAIGRNQHGEHVVAMKPERFLDYLNQYKPSYHPNGEAGGDLLPTGRSMGDLVAEAELEEAAPADAVGADLPPAFDPAMIEDGRERVAREIAIRRGQAGFRNQLLEAYGCCAMSGCTVASALEAAHIVPYQGPGTNHPSNGLLLRADLHTLFDLGLLSVDSETLQVLVAPDLDGTEYAALRGQPLHVDHASVSPSREALRLHRSFANL